MGRVWGGRPPQGCWERFSTRSEGMVHGWSWSRHGLLHLSCRHPGFSGNQTLSPSSSLPHHGHAGRSRAGSVQTVSPGHPWLLPGSATHSSFCLHPGEAWLCPGHSVFPLHGEISLWVMVPPGSSLGWGQVPGNRAPGCPDLEHSFLWRRQCHYNPRVMPEVCKCVCLCVCVFVCVHVCLCTLVCLGMS